LNKKRVSLALQGGGSHGAFTWGALTRVLEDDHIVIDGISGTSAGAMNGALLVAGMMEGGPDVARRKLDRFWEMVAEKARWSLFQPTWLDQMFGPGNLDYSPAFQLFDFATRILSPYDFNPMDFHPLREILDTLLDFPALRAYEDIRFFASTTHVRTGKIRVFDLNEITAEVLLASACLPLVFRAVEIDGEAYWDGGFTGNPALFPLVYDCTASDVVLIEINPLNCGETPRRSRDILNRMHDIGFNATLMREMRSIAFVTHLIDAHELADRSSFRRINFHMIEGEDALQKYGASSRFNCDRTFLRSLRDLGWAAADRWLSQHGSKLGQTSSIDVHALFV
jgi:NTE family protein